MPFSFKAYGVTHVYESREDAIRQGWRENFNKKYGTFWTKIVPPDIVKDKDKDKKVVKLTPEQEAQRLRNLIDPKSPDLSNLPKPVIPISTETVGGAIETPLKPFSANVEKNRKKPRARTPKDPGSVKNRAQREYDRQVAQRVAREEDAIAKRRASRQTRRIQNFKNQAADDAQKTGSSLKAGRQYAKYDPVYKTSTRRFRRPGEKNITTLKEVKLIGFNKIVNEQLKDFISFDPNQPVQGLGSYFDYSDLTYNETSVTRYAKGVKDAFGNPLGGKIIPEEEISEVSHVYRTTSRQMQARVKAGRIIEFSGKTYKGGQLVPDMVRYMDTAQLRMYHGMPIRDDLVAILQENLPTSRIEEMMRRTGYYDKSFKNAKRFMDAVGIDVEDFLRPSYGQSLVNFSRILEFDKQEKIRLEERAAQKAERKLQREITRQQNRARRAISLRLLEKGAGEVPTSPIRTAPVTAQISMDIVDDMVDEGARQATAKVTSKKTVSSKTLRSLMDSNMMAAGVVAGAAGIAYMFNKSRAEDQFS